MRVIMTQRERMAETWNPSNLQNLKHSVGVAFLYKKGES
jgi:hypothetical protein